MLYFVICELQLQVGIWKVCSRLFHLSYRGLPLTRNGGTHTCTCVLAVTIFHGNSCCQPYIVYVCIGSPHAVSALKHCSFWCLHATGSIWHHLSPSRGTQRHQLWEITMWDWGFYSSLPHSEWSVHRKDLYQRCQYSKVPSIIHVYSLTQVYSIQCIDRMTSKDLHTRVQCAQYPMPCNHFLLANHCPFVNSQVLHFTTNVRCKEPRQLTIHNKSNTRWLLTPIIDGPQWSGPDSISIDPNSPGHYELTYHPLTMTTENEKHHGSIFFPYPDGTGHFQILLGTAEPPKMIAQISQEIPCKTPHIELLTVENWSRRPQRWHRHICTCTRLGSSVGRVST